MKNKNMKMEFSGVSLHKASDDADKMTLEEFFSTEDVFAIDWEEVVQ